MVSSISSRHSRALVDFLSGVGAAITEVVEVRDMDRRWSVDSIVGPAISSGINFL